MMEGTLDTVIVGAGQAGLGTSYCLQLDGRKHVVFEKGGVGETWRSQRWDSFQLNTPNSFSTLPGLPYEGTEPDGFWRHDELVSYFERYVASFRLPVRTGVMVRSVGQDKANGRFIVNTDAAGAAHVSCRSVVIASGIQQAPKFPEFSLKVPGAITQIHTASYRNAAALPPGAVVVVGSAQSGVQIAEDLAACGRKVYLCTSKVGRNSRRYRGRDSMHWSATLGLWDVTLASLTDKSISRRTQAQISGVGRYGHTVSLQGLARQGVVILGKLLDVDGHCLVLSDEAAAHVRYADEHSRRRKEEIDAHLARAGITPPPLEDDPADAPDSEAACASSLRRLDLREARVSSIIWATGFTADFSWIDLPVLDASGRPVHDRGVSPVPGLYFIGFPWLNSRKSGLIVGITEDAGYIAKAIAKRVSETVQ